jgi:predicted phosphodiesterase
LAHALAAAFHDPLIDRENRRTPEVMRYLILSDIHSNIEALDACLQRARSAGFDEVLCCGDLVGYGPNPVEVIDRVRELGGPTIRGNHDRGAVDATDTTNFNQAARQALDWTRSVLPDSHLEYLATLPVGPLNISPDAQLVHGGIADEDDYIFTTTDATEHFVLADKKFTFFGHSHFPVAFSLNRQGQSVRASRYQFDGFDAVKCDVPAKFLINSGSVGQSRDSDVRASFAIWDQESQRVEFYRVEYDLKTTQAKMAAVHLPTYLIERLAYGR